MNSVESLPPFKKIDASDLDGVWAWAAPRIQACRSDPDEVRHSLEAGEASLWIIQNGLLVLEPVFSDERQRLEICIWVGFASGRGNMAAYWPVVDKLAKRVGAAAVFFNTQRRGFARALGAGWAERPGGFVREIEHGR